MIFALIFSISLSLWGEDRSGALFVVCTTFYKTFDNSPAAFTNKSYNIISFIGSRLFFFNNVKRLRCVHPFIINNAVDVQYLVDSVERKTLAFKTNGIYTGIT